MNLARTDHSGGHRETARAPDDSPQLSFHCARTLSGQQRARWAELAATVPWAHYRQHPDWGEIERRDGTGGARLPVYFWAEREGTVCLTAIGVRRTLPIPGRVFWQFDKGPVFNDVDVLDGWLPWMVARVKRESARLRLAPPVPLPDGGDDVETLLEQHNFTRRRLLGGWSTLVLSLEPEEEAIHAGFRPATQRAIRKSRRLGIEVSAHDTPFGWSVLADLQAELAQRSPVSSVTREDIARISAGWLQGGTGGTVLLACHEEEPLAAALLVVYQGTAYLPMIPSSRRSRELPASHLLVWEAIRLAKALGCTKFDFEGYGLTARPGSSVWGINQFKRGFASLDRLTKCVAVHEQIGSPLIVAAASTLRSAERNARARLHDAAGQLRSSPGHARPQEKG